MLKRRPTLAYLIEKVYNAQISIILYLIILSMIHLFTFVKHLVCAVLDGNKGSMCSPMDIPLRKRKAHNRPLYKNMAASETTTDIDKAGYMMRGEGNSYENFVTTYHVLKLKGTVIRYQLYSFFPERDYNQ